MGQEKALLPTFRSSINYILKQEHVLQLLVRKMLVTRWQITTLLWKSLVSFIKAQDGRGKRQENF